VDELPAMSSIEVRRMKRWLKRGPKLTRQGRAEFSRWLLALDDESHASQRNVFIYDGFTWKVFTWWH
jgi:hypothetical protein